MSPATASPTLANGIGLDIGKGAEAGARSAPAPPLPCLSSNNSIEVWTEIGELSPYHKRVAETIQLNVQYLAERYGIERIGFLTLTFAEFVKLQEAQRRWNSCATNFLREEFVEYMMIAEFTRRGWVHYHLLVVCKEDIRTGFDFTAQYLATSPSYAHMIKERRQWTKKYATAAAPYLRALWKRLRAKLKVYGFGRHELLPIKKTGLAVAYYVGKYVSKCVINRRPEAKGARFVRYSQGWKTASVHFAWVTTRSWLWRKKVGILAKQLGAVDTDDLQRLCGKHWAYHMKDHIMGLTDLTRYPTWYHAELDGWRVPENVKNRTVAFDQSPGFDAVAAHCEDMRVGIAYRYSALEVARSIVQQNPVSHEVWKKWQASQKVPRHLQY